MAAEKQQQQQQIKEERTKKLQYEKRKSTLLKGAKELSILCGIDVCLVVLSPDGKLESWPENLDDVRAAFRAAAQSNKRPRSENNRKRRRSPSQVGIDDAEKGNKKMKADISDEFHAMGNNFKGEEEVAAGVLEMGKKTEEDHHHHHQLSLSNCCGNCYLGFPAFGQWNNSFAAGIGNYENQIHHQGCSVGYGGGGYSSSYGYEIQNLHNNDNNNHLNEWNNDDYASRAAMFDPLCVQPLQSRLGGDFQFGNYYYI